MVIDCKNIISLLPIHSSFDYKFKFAESSEFRFNLKKSDKMVTISKVNPVGMNGFVIANDGVDLNEYLPELEIKINNYGNIDNLVNIQNESEQFKIPSDFMFVEPNGETRNDLPTFL